VLKKRIQGPCEHCGSTILFLVDAIGTRVTCPNCGEMTELTLERPAEQPTIPRRMIIFASIALVILLAGLGASLYALKRAQNLKTKQPSAPAQPAQR
jgi:predicted RNA-binding Zn-ribbon protein involved in translation (DUF1610 family)